MGGKRLAELRAELDNLQPSFDDGQRFPAQ
jgi:hypothetical protein